MITQDSTVPDWSAVSGATYWKDIEHKEYAESKITAPLIVLDTSHPFCITPQLHPPIEIMRGCNCGCMYCQTPRLHAHKVRYRSLESIEQSVAHYAKVFPPPLDLRIIAPNALAYQSPDGKHPNLEALEALLALAKKNIARFYLGSFPSEVRPDFVTKETVSILQRCDSRVVAVGAQAGSDSELKRMARGHTVDDVRNAVKLLVEGGLKPYVDFILCCPDETPEEQCATVRVCSELLEKGCEIRLHHFMPLPGTPWAKKEPVPLCHEAQELLNPLLGDSRVQGAFERQREQNRAPESAPERKKNKK